MKYLHKEDEEDSQYYNILEHNNGDGCKDNKVLYGDKIENARDELLDEVKLNIMDSMENQLDADRCLITR